MYCVGVDTGGTFTDFAALDLRTGFIHALKVPSTPWDPAVALTGGLKLFDTRFGISPSKIVRFVFGTTVATNAVLERKGARTALLASLGTRDVIEIQRQYRHRLFDLSLRKPEPIVPRRLRIEVEERMGADRRPVVELTDAAIDRAVEAVAGLDAEAVAISLLFSFLNPAHERRLAAALARANPSLHVTMSSDVCPEFREFERTTTTAMNAYVMPKIDWLIDRLVQALADSDCPADLQIIQSNGGLMSARQAKASPVRTLLSGPAGGVVGAIGVGSGGGARNLLTMDMGGTSVDICIVENGAASLSTDSELGGFPLRVPQINVHTIGAGGGSLARVSRGTLKVGPQSAGADPGPVCYGRGGTQPTSTDCAVVLGLIDPDYFLGGEMKLDLPAAREAIRTELAEPLGMRVEEAALAVVRVQVAQIVSGIRNVSVEKGLDPREFVLLPFGGAGNLYSGLIAEELGVAEILVPIHASILSALGMLMSDVKYTGVAACLMPAAQTRAVEARERFDTLREQVLADMASERLDRGAVSFELSADMRYAGQAFEINIPVPESALVDDSGIAGLVMEFNSEHKRLYGYSVAGEPVQFVNLRVTALGCVQKAELPARADNGRDPAPTGRRRVHLEDAAAREVPVWHRADLPARSRIIGPAIVEDSGASIPILPGHRLRVDTIGNLRISVAPREEANGARH
ncbi:MAG: 5-oxoprolinase [Alphaproteobacteria bacterium]|nr:MAG: 5-oxoprolinase [Alphaproteobacteria bacterium]